MSNVKLKLLHVLEILLETDEHHTINATQIVERLLKDFNIETERKSVCRDIATLQAFGHDIIADRDKRKGWYYGKRKFEPWQIRLFLDAISNAPFVSKQDFKYLFNELIKELGPNDKKLFKDTIPVVNGFKKTHDANLKNVLSEILRSISMDRAMEFQIYTYDNRFKSVLRRGSHVYKADPFTLLWYKNRYYLVGSLTEENQLRMFRIDRIANPRTTGTPRRKLNEVLGNGSAAQLADFCKTSFHNKTTDKTYDLVTISLMDPEYAGIFVDLFGIPSEVKKDDNGVLEASLKKFKMNEEIKKILISHADIFKVVFPDDLRNEIKKEIKARLDNYKN